MILLDERVTLVYLEFLNYPEEIYRIIVRTDFDQ
jgi:hypothetical protein